MRPAIRQGEAEGNASFEFTPLASDVRPRIIEADQIVLRDIETDALCHRPPRTAELCGIMLISGREPKRVFRLVLDHDPRCRGRLSGFEAGPGPPGGHGVDTLDALLQTLQMQHIPFGKVEAQAGFHTGMACAIDDLEAVERIIETLKQIRESMTQLPKALSILNVFHRLSESLS